MKFSIKTALVSGLVLASSGLAAPAVSARDLTVVSWGGSYQEAQREIYFKPFSEKIGKPVLDEAWDGGISVLQAKVKAGSPNWDVVQVEAEELALGCPDGLHDFDRIAVVLVGRCTHGNGCAATSISLPLNQCDGTPSGGRLELRKSIHDDGNKSCCKVVGRLQGIELKPSILAGPEIEPLLEAALMSDKALPATSWIEATLIGNEIANFALVQSFRGRLQVNSEIRLGQQFTGGHRKMFICTERNLDCDVLEPVTVIDDDLLVSRDGHLRGYCHRH
ncbi:hypothetical protein ACFZPV_008171 (plasmid) [Rhizobium ruizarguesonis]